MKSERLKAIGTAVFLLVLIPLTVAAAYHMAGPNARDLFDLSLVTTRIDLDDSPAPLVALRLTNRSTETVTIEQVDADYGCRITIEPEQSRIKIQPGETVEVTSLLHVDHAFLVPRTRSEIVLPVTFYPIVSDEAGHSFVLPPYSFEQSFRNRVTASSEIIRIASAPEPSDPVGSSRTLALQGISDAIITSVQLDPDASDGLQLTVDYATPLGSKVIVAVSLVKSETDTSSDLGPRETTLVIQTEREGVSDSKSSVRIPIQIRPSWSR